MPSFGAELTITLAAHATVSILTLASHASHIINVARVAKASAHTKLLATWHAKAHAVRLGANRRAAALWAFGSRHLEGLVVYRHHYETALVLTLILAVMHEMTRAALVGTWMYAFAETLVTGREG